MIEPIKPGDKSFNSSQGAVAEQQLFERRDVTSPVVERKQDVPSAREEIPREEVEKAAEKMNRLLGIVDKRFNFKIHDSTGQVMLDVIDLDSGEVINEIPSKKLLDFLGSFRELVGMLVDERV